MTAYLVTRGMSFASIGVWSGIASATGMFGTAFYARSIRITSVENTGMWSLSLQFFCLTFSFASSFVANPAVSSALLIGGVIVSRIGRWVFEVALVQLMQTYVPAEVRGTVGGVHSALYSFSALLAFVLGLVFPDPNQFWIFVWSGYGVVGIALLLYAFGVWKRQDVLQRSLLTAVLDSNYHKSEEGGYGAFGSVERMRPQDDLTERETMSVHSGSASSLTDMGKEDT